EVSGVGLVTIEGNQKPAVRIQINPAAIAALGMSLEDVRTAIVANSVNAPKGSFNGTRQSYALNANDQIFSGAEYADVIIAYKNGSPIRIRDLGNAVDNVENVRLGSWVGGQPAVLIDIQRQPGANIIQTVDRVKALLPRLQLALPSSVKLAIFSDRTETIRASIKDVQFTLVLAVMLVVLVIFLFLRKFWATVIPGIALPVTIIGTFGLMKLIGFSLDNLSLMALTIATGFVVDDAIVMIENIVRHIENGQKPMTAALEGARQIGFTIISLSLSLVAVFIPLLFMTGIVGRLFQEFALTLCAAVAVSAVVSLTLTPMMCARLLQEEAAESPGRFFTVTENFFRRLLGGYETGLQWVLRHQRFTLGVAGVALAATVLLYIWIPKGLLPEQDTGLIIGVTDASQAISYQAMIAKQHAIAEVVAQDPDVRQVASFVGAGSVNATVNSGRLYLMLKPRDERAASAQQIIDRLRAATAGVQGISLFMQAAQDVQIDSRVSRTQYQFTLEDSDSAELAEWSQKLMAKLAEQPELTDVASDQQNGGQQVSLTVDRQK
ncbi:MAG TPA: efflux RND transporter permease subunit, partial [Verrucomicrobiae bacterium]